ncbi:MAG: type I restriction-modification system subunit M [bacterium]
MSEEQKRLLEQQLWAIADLLRGKMNADEYKNYVLGFIFLKYLSEKQEIYADNLLKQENSKYTDLISDKSKEEEYLPLIKEASIGGLGFFLKPNQLFAYLVKKGNKELGDDNFIIEDLKNILNAIEQNTIGHESEEDFIGLFEDIDLSSAKLGKSEKQKNEIIIEILARLNKIDFKLSDAKSDVLGDAYEYLIGQFAAGAGKKGGEFYTPAQVSRILAQIVTSGKEKIRSVYDPTCGSGSLLIRVKDYVNVTEFYGQELNRTTYNLARMNMILHGINYSQFHIKQGDTLTDDYFPDLRAEAVVANPPFSAIWKGKNNPLLSNDERFNKYGALAPVNKADYAFATHMLHHLADNGTMAIVLPHGVLFRGGSEETIRKYIIEKLNYLNAVIGLPSNLFYGTSIPVCVLVFSKCRKEDDSVLFIDASKEFEKSKNQNILTDENIAKIVETYKEKKEIDKFSRLVSLKEIKDNDYNLNIPRYLDTFEKEESIDLESLATEIKKLEMEEIDVDKEIDGYCKELGINPPFEISEVR